MSTAALEQPKWKITGEAPLLAVSGLETRFTTPDGIVHAVNGISFTVNKGETIGIVGESGSGKSQLLMSIMGLLPQNGTATGSVKFAGREILGLKRDDLNKIRGTRMAMIFQDPMTSLNPYLTVGKQLTEVLTFHQNMNEATIQAEILNLLAEQQAVTGTAIILVTHDLGVVAQLCDRVFVMYAGRLVEQGTVRQIFYDPQHPYTRALLHSMPRLTDDVGGDLPTIGGQPPNLANLPPGCAFAERCDYCLDACLVGVPPLRNIGPERWTACRRDGSDLTK